MVLFAVLETVNMPISFLNTSTCAILTSSSQWKQEKGQLPFLDVVLSKQSTSDNQCSCVTSVFRKKTYTGLLTNFFSFTPFKYKLGLIKTLIDRAYKINNTTQGFQNDIKNLSVILKCNLFPSWLIDKSVKGYLKKIKTTEQDVDTATSDTSKCRFYKLPYIGFYSTYTEKILSVINKHCKDLNVKVIFSPFEVSSMFSPKYFITESLKSRVVYQFTCASCGARYIGKPIGIFIHVLMNIFFRTKIPMFLNISIVLSIVEMIVMPPVLKLLILLRLSHNLKSRRVFILIGYIQNSTNKLSMSIYRFTFKCIYFSLVVFHYCSFQNFYWLV